MQGQPEIVFSPEERLRRQAASSEALLKALEEHDYYSAKHSRNVAMLAGPVAAEMGLAKRPIADVLMVAKLHDVGKLAIPPKVLEREGPLSARETAGLPGHSLAGESIIRQLPELRHIAWKVRCCHERWDGMGYPNGLAGDRIPLASRIVFVCDAFEWMVAARPRGGGMLRPLAAREVRRYAGSQFCPASVDALLRTLPDLRIPPVDPAAAVAAI